MRLREQVGDLAQGRDVPLRHAVLLHRFDPAVLEAAALDLALADALHDLERELGVHTAADEVEHDIVAAADRLVDRRRAGHDEVLRVAEPHVRAV